MEHSPQRIEGECNRMIEIGLSPVRYRVFAFIFRPDTSRKGE